MLGAEENNDAVGLRVEARGDVLECLCDDLLDARRGGGEVLVERVDGAAGLDELKEGVGVGGHGCFGDGGSRSRGGGNKA